MQFEACKALLQGCKHHGLSTAVETTGDVPWEKLKECLPYIDIFLFDYKHCDLVKLKQITGANSERIMDNLQRLASMVSKKIILRIPVIPDFNYEDAVLKQMIDTACNLAVAQVHLLPYHTLGLSKYEQLGRTYAMKGIEMLHKENLQSYVEYGRQKGVYVQAGG